MGSGGQKVTRAVLIARSFGVVKDGERASEDDCWNAGRPSESSTHEASSD